MSDEPIQLSEAEQEDSLALLASIDLEVPEEWNGAERSALIRKIPGSNVEMRYNVRPNYGDENSFFHYWSVMAGSYGRMLIVRTQELGQTELVGFNIEHDEEAGEFFRHDVWSYGYTDRTHSMSVDAADAIQIQQMIPENPQVRENLDELLAQWLTYDCLPDIMWTFVLTTLYSEMVSDLSAKEVEDESAVTP